MPQCGLPEGVLYFFAKKFSWTGIAPPHPADNDTESILQGGYAEMPKTPEDAAKAVRETPPVTGDFWTKARALAEWMEEQDSRTN